jgi:multiple sugar transport system permease protein
MVIGVMTNTQIRCGAHNLFGSALYIFLLRQLFLGLPREVFEAARVDGASCLRLRTG